MIANKGYGRASDYWSLGCVAYEMLNGLPPFSSKQGSKELFRKIMQERIKMPPGSSAAACKLLKGLLNRNAQARLGAARSTMFEVGGVAGLKGAAFFSKIDWDKLEQKQMEPPYKLSVESDQDLRHFHDEFTNMTLPRSVMDISTSTALPRRVDSSAFRGFSFIQEDFKLPDRKASDIEKYWNAEADGDGESVSETASSKFDLGNDLGNDATSAPAAPAGAQGPEGEPQSEKKKRPPRKRKKKKEGAGSTATLSVASKSPVPSEQGEKPEAAEVTTVSKEIEPNVAESKATDIKQSVPVFVPEQNAPKSSPAVKPLVAKQNVTTPVKGNLPAPGPSQNNKSKPGQESWQSIGSGKKIPPATNMPRQSPTVRATPQQLQAQQTASHQRTGGWGSSPGVVGAATTPLHSAASPGSWAARIQKASPAMTTTPSSTKAEPPQTPPTGKILHAGWGPRQPPPPPSSRQISTSSIGSNDVPPSPSSDWRQHSSPQVRRALHRSSLRDDNDRNKQFLTDAPKWPSLKDFPPAQAAAPSATPNKPTLKGAWASRTKS